MKAQSHKIENRWPIIILMATSFVLNFNTLSNGFVLDDDVVFLKNRYVQEGVSAIDDILTHGFLYGFNQRNDQSYRPLVLIDFAIEKSIFGNNPGAHHFMNLLYYGLLVIILYLLLRRMMPEYNLWVPFWIAIVFLAHPIHTEVVANIKGRDELFHAILASLSLYQALIYFDTQDQKHLYLSAFFFFLALLSKEMAVTLIALIPLVIYFFREVKLSVLVKLSLPYLGVFLLYMLIRNLVLDDITFEEDMSVINNTIAGASNLSERLGTTILIFGNYIKLLFFPHPLSWDYSYPHFPIVGMNYPWVILITALSLTIIVFAFYKLKQKNIYAFSVLFFLISFSVVSNFFILIGATLGERFLFFPSLAFCILIVILIKELDERFFKTRRKYGLPMIAMLLILLPFAAKTFDRNQDWESNETLFISGVEASPNNSRAVSALASIYRVRGEQATNIRDQQFNLMKARDYYLESIRLYNDNVEALYNLGVTYGLLENKEKARMAYSRVVELSPNNINALNNMGVFYFQENRYDKAEEYFKRAMEIQPNFANSYANLGAVYHNQGKFDQARLYYEKAIQLNPSDVNSRNNLNLLLGN